MDSTLKMTSTIVLPICSSYSTKLTCSTNKISYDFQFSACRSTRSFSSVSIKGSVPRFGLKGAQSSSAGDMCRQRSSLESLFCYDKPIPEERIEKPVGLSMAEKVIGDNPRCVDCEAKGAVLCTTCSGSGLYVDSILESQGIIVKVRCLGCGGSGNIMCTECGGRGHRGSKL